jgi:hypothetical protein
MMPPIVSTRRATRHVFKYPVPMPNETGRAFIDVPTDAEILSVGLQNDQMVVWALSDPDYEPEEGYEAVGMVRLIVANTGQEIPGFPEGARFLGTVTTSNGTVWHVWDGDAETTA